jgi:hypothetical protein
MRSVSESVSESPEAIRALRERIRVANERIVTAVDGDDAMGSEALVQMAYTATERMVYDTAPSELEAVAAETLATQAEVWIRLRRGGQ